MAASVLPVLVAGAGPAGLVAALTLLQNDVPVRIIDKEPHYRIGQRASGLRPRSFEVFHLLRVHEMHERATPMLPVREYKPGTLEPTKNFTFAHNDPTPSIPYNNPAFLGQTTLESILRCHLERYGCSVELGTELVSFKDDGERVLAKLVKKKNDEVFETFEASYLIGADGAKGIIRKQLGFAFLGETRQDVSLAVDICMEINGVDRDHWHFLTDMSGNTCMLHPTDDIAPDGFRALMPFTGCDLKQIVTDEKWLLKRLSEMTGQEIIVRKIDVVSEFRSNIRMVEKFGLGRVFIAGDSAHVHSPSGGQGLNTCIQDAFNLSWKIALVHRGLSPAVLLDTYTTERLPVIAEMLNITTGMLNKGGKRPTIMDAIGSEERLNMLGVNYRTSPIVVDEYTRAEAVSAYGALEEGMLVAGDRAPDASGLIVTISGVQMETRLFDIFSATYHTVLVFTCDASSVEGILDVLAEYPGDSIRPIIVLPQQPEGATFERVDVVIDQGTHAYQAYLAENGEQRVVVVRPDGVTGAIVHGIEGVRTYFSRIFV